MNNKTPGKNIRRQLLDWYVTRRRRLPWRDTRDPYRIWISEVMLQQTQVGTVVPYYGRFLDTFPEIEDLAAADLERVLKLWEGLGYYARARNLHRAAGIVVADHAGLVPEDPVVFRTLPGVGEYICAAVMSIAFGQPLAVIDGNVKRVLARLFEIDAPVNKSSSTKIFRRTADGLLDHKVPGDFNQAVMELGALVCRPANPLCHECPVGNFCGALRNSRQKQLPVRAPRKPVPVLRVAVGVIENNGRILLTKRAPEGLLGGLWEFPGGKLEGGEQSIDACAREVREETGIDVEIVERVARIKHAYTHFKVDLDVYRCNYRGGEIVLDGPVDYRWVTLEEMDDLPLPGASHKILPHLRERSGEEPVRS